MDRFRRGRSRRARPDIYCRARVGRNGRQQPAEAGSRRAAAQAAHLVCRGRAALAVQVHAPRRPEGCQRPADHHAAHVDQQVLSPRRRHAGRAGGRLSQRRRGIVRIRRADNRELRSGLLHAQAAGGHQGIRQSARGDAADVGRTQRARCRRLAELRNRRCPAGCVGTGRHVVHKGEGHG